MFHYFGARGGLGAKNGSPSVLEDSRLGVGRLTLPEHIQMVRRLTSYAIYRYARRVMEYAARCGANE
jgi:hypothetical protein